MISSLFKIIRFPGKKPQNIDVDSKTVTAAKRSRKENTVKEILGESHNHYSTIISTLRYCGVSLNLTAFLLTVTLVFPLQNLVEFITRTPINTLLDQAKQRITCLNRLYKMCLNSDSFRSSLPTAFPLWRYFTFVYGVGLFGYLLWV